MKSINLIYFILGIIILCFLSIFLFTLPSFIPHFNISNTGSIGDTIGGITAPIIGIFSAILLFLALTKQVESNKEQRFKNESDIFFLLINQVENEISNFYSKYSIKRGYGLNDKTEFIRSYGVEGLDDFTYRLLHNPISGNEISFSNYFEANQIMMILTSYKITKLNIDNSLLDNKIKNILSLKLHNIYMYRLKEPLSLILEAVKKKPVLKDHLTEEIESFIEFNYL